MVCFRPYRPDDSANPVNPLFSPSRGKDSDSRYEKIIDYDDDTIMH